MSTEPDPLDHFTDRKEELAAFERLWQPGSRRVLCLSGISGIGKTTLLEYLRLRHRPRRPWALVDLSEDSLQIGYLFLTKVAGQFRNMFPYLAWDRFDAAKDKVSSRQPPTSSVQKNENTTQTIQKASWWGRIVGSPPSVVVGGAVESAVARRELVYEVASRQELWQALCEVLKEAPPFCIMVDTVEVVAHAQTPFWAWFVKDFVIELEQGVPEARLVVAGRERFPSDFPAIKVKIEPWDQDESKQFLTKRGVDPGLAGVIIQNCQGNPWVATRAANFLQDSDQRLPRQLGKGTTDLAAAWLMTEVYQRLPLRLAPIVEVAARLRAYDRALIYHLLGEKEPRVDDGAFAELVKLSLTDGQPRPHAHDLVRQAEDASFRQQPIAYHKFHLKASRYCTNAGDVIGGLYHGLAAKEEEFAKRWWEAIENARLRHDLTMVAELISVLEAPERQQLRTREGLLRLDRAQQALSLADSTLAANEPESQRQAHAKELFDQAREFFMQADSAWGVATADKALGDLQARTGDLDGAIGSYKGALKRYEEIHDRPGQAGTLLALGELQVRTGPPDAAKRSYEYARRLYHKVGSRLGKAHTLRALGDLQVRTGRPGAAKRSYEHALKLYRRINSTQQAMGRYQRIEALLNLAGTTLSLADLRRDTGRQDDANRSYGDAQSHYEAALKLYGQVKDKPGQADTWWNLGNLQINLGDLQVGDGRPDEAKTSYRKAEISYREALRLYQGYKDGLTQATTWELLGDLQANAGRRDDAETSYREALELYRQAEDRGGHANTRRKLGELQAKDGRSDEAETSYRKALELYQELKDVLLQASTREVLGNLQANAAGGTTPRPPTGRRWKCTSRPRIGVARPTPCGRWATSRPASAGGTTLNAPTGRHWKCTRGSETGSARPTPCGRWATSRPASAGGTTLNAPTGRHWKCTRS